LMLADQWDAMAERLETQTPLGEILSRLDRFNDRRKPKA
jgi:hypothetical protein